MRLGKRSSALVATAIAAAMVLSACGGSDEEAVVTAGRRQQWRRHVHHLSVSRRTRWSPGNTNESEGSQIVKALWTGLVEYAEDSEVQYTGVAESIESEDPPRGRSRSRTAGPSTTAPR